LNFIFLWENKLWIFTHVMFAMDWTFQNSTFKNEWKAKKSYTLNILTEFSCCRYDNTIRNNNKNCEKYKIENLYRRSTKIWQINLFHCPARTVQLVKASCVADWTKTRLKRPEFNPRSKRLVFFFNIYFSHSYVSFHVFIWFSSLCQAIASQQIF
jgi:hypothetical protein